MKRRDILKGAAAVGLVKVTGLGIERAYAEAAQSATSESGVFVDWTAKVIDVTKPISLDELHSLLSSAEDDRIYHGEDGLNIEAYMDLPCMTRFSNVMFAISEEWSLTDSSIQNLYGGALQIGDDLYTSYVSYTA